jgi:hypothetical protein
MTDTTQCLNPFNRQWTGLRLIHIKNCLDHAGAYYKKYSAVHSVHEGYLHILHMNIVSNPTGS